MSLSDQLSRIRIERHDRVAAARTEVRLFRDINAISPGDWDSVLDAERVQLSHRFVRLCQESRVEDADYWHLLLSQRGRLCGVATLSRIDVRVDLLAGQITRRCVAAVRRCWKRFLRVPVLFCGLPVSFGQPCLALTPWADAADACLALAGIMERVATETGTRLLCIKEFDPPSADRLEPLTGHGFLRAHSLPSCSLALPYASFAGYLNAMTAGYRRQARATLNAGRAAGLRVRLLDRFATQGDVIFALYEQVIRRARYRLETLNRAFIDRLDTDLGEQSRAILIERDGRTLAAAIMLYAAGTATFLLAGLDYQAERRWQVYPNLVLEVVAEAIRAGATRLEMGQTSYPMKMRLGAVTVPRFLFLRHRGTLTHRLLAWSNRFLFPEHHYPARHVFRKEAAAASAQP
jgi:predicted N-acyltransferase